MPVANNPKMTVAEALEKLKKLPADAIVESLIVSLLGTSKK